LKKAALSMPSHTSPFRQEIVTAVRREVVEQQLDTINVLAESLATAIRDGAAENEAEVRASLDRFVATFRWGADARLLAILAYANARDDSDDDLFAPAFILTSTAPDHPETGPLLARLSEDAHALLEYVIPA
jgi:hypothetical protein